MSTLNLFDGIPMLTLTRAAGEDAGIACLDRAEKVAGFDSEGAAAFILGIVTASGPTPGEVLTDRAIAAGYKPHDARAFGPVYATLVRRGSIRCVGFCERKKGHSSAGGRIWSAA